MKWCKSAYRGCLLALGLAWCLAVACAPGVAVPMRGNAQVQGATTKNGPPPLSSHVMTYHAGLSMVVMFGGSNPERQLMNTLWGWNGSAWQILSEGGPVLRVPSHAAVSDARGVHRGLLLLVRLLLAGARYGSALDPPFVVHTSRFESRPDLRLP